MRNGTLAALKSLADWIVEDDRTWLYGAAWVGLVAFVALVLPDGDGVVVAGPISAELQLRAFAPGIAADTTPGSGRALADQPDDASGPQVHVMYVVPADGIDNLLDINGRIAASVSSFQTWLREQTGGRALRLDTHESST